MKKIEYDTLSLIQEKLSKGRKTKIALSIAISSDNTKAYVACGYNDVVIFDITDIPIPVGSFITNGYAFSIVLSDDGKIAYVADGANGIVVKDVSNLNNIQNIPTYGETGQIIDLKISKDGTRAYAVNYKEGLIVYKIIENIPYCIELHKIASYSMPYWNKHSFVVSNDDKTIFVLKEDSGIDTIELCNDKIITKESFTTQDKINRIILSDNQKIAYAVSGENVIVLSIENNSLKKVINTHFLNGFVEDIIISGSYAYAKIGKDLIELVSIVKF